MNTALKGTLAVTGWALLLILTGCDADTASPERAGGATPRARGTADFASRRIEGAGLAEVQTIADRVFRSYFRVDRGASTANDLLAYPTDVNTREATTRGEEPVAEEPTRAPRDTVGDMIGVAPRRYRRIAELRLAAAENGVVAQVRVMFQRLTSAERAAFARERGDDRPTDTAIDRLGPTSPAPREEWRDDRRDKRLEQEILNALQSGLTATRPAGGG